jgi:hypothetical protein
VPLIAARWGVGAALIAVGAFASPARAEPLDEKEICASAFERGQELELAGRLNDARAAFVRCAAATCPLVLTPPCLKAAQRLDGEIPSIVIAARSSEGEEVSDARVLIDGELRAERLDGRALALDPGPHRLRIERLGSPAAEREIQIRVGERNRLIEVSFADPRAAEPALGPAAPKPAPEQPSPKSTSKTPALVALAVGGVGVSVGAVAGALALSNKLDLDRACPTRATCDPSRGGQIAAMKAQSTVSTVGFVAGAAGIALGVVLFVFVLREPDDPGASGGPGPSAAAGARIALGPGSIELRGSF